MWKNDAEAHTTYTALLSMSLLTEDIDSEYYINFAREKQNPNTSSGKQSQYLGRAGRRRSGEEQKWIFFSAFTVFSTCLQMAYHHMLDGFFSQEVLTQLGRLSIYSHLMQYFFNRTLLANVTEYYETNKSG
jgi:hypothetical protein